MPSIAHLFPQSDSLFPERVESASVNIRTPPTFGQRVKYARKAAGLTQEQFAAALRGASGDKIATNKGSVSQYESDKVKNPLSTTVLAISAVTGFAQNWLLHGKGPERATLPELTDRQSETSRMMRHAVMIAARVHETPAAIADAAVEVFCTLADEPDAPEAALRRVARLTHTKPKS